MQDPTWPLTGSFNYPPVIINSNGDFEVRWVDNSSCETGYQVEYSTDQITWTVVNYILNTIDVTLNPITNNTVHYFRVKALGTPDTNYTSIESKLSMPGPVSNVFDITQLEGRIIVFDLPANLGDTIEVYLAPLSTTSFTLRNTINVDGGKVYSETNGTYLSSGMPTGINQMGYIFNGLVSGTSYVVKFRVRNASGFSNYSSNYNFIF